MRKIKTDVKGLILLILGTIIGIALKKANLWIVLGISSLACLFDIYVGEKEDC